MPVLTVSMSEKLTRTYGNEPQWGKDGIAQKADGAGADAAGARGGTHPQHAHRVEVTDRASAWNCDICRQRGGKMPDSLPRYRCTEGCDWDVCASCFAMVRTMLLLLFVLLLVMTLVMFLLLLLLLLLLLMLTPLASPRERHPTPPPPPPLVVRGPAVSLTRSGRR